VHEKEKAYLGEIIDEVNGLYVNNVICGQTAGIRNAASAGCEQHQRGVRNSPDLNADFLNAIMGALDAYIAMSTQALNS
jgi:hypothetical protein